MTEISKKYGILAKFSVEERIKNRKPLAKAKIAGLCSANPEERTKHTLERIALTDELWTAWNRDFIVETCLNNSTRAIPVWPYKETAELCLKNSSVPFSDTIPIPIDDFINEILHAGNPVQGVTVFPTKEHSEAIFYSVSKFCESVSNHYQRLLPN